MSLARIDHGLRKNDPWASWVLYRHSPHTCEGDCMILLLGNCTVTWSGLDGITDKCLKSRTLLVRTGHEPIMTSPDQFPAL